MKVNLKACQRCYKFEPHADHDISDNTVKSSGILLACNGDWKLHYRGMIMGRMTFDDENRHTIEFNKDFKIPSDCAYKLEQTL